MVYDIILYNILVVCYYCKHTTSRISLDIHEFISIYIYIYLLLVLTICITYALILMTAFDLSSLCRSRPEVCSIGSRGSRCTLAWGPGSGRVAEAEGLLTLSYLMLGARFISGFFLECLLFPIGIIP